MRIAAPAHDLNQVMSLLSPNGNGRALALVRSATGTSRYLAGNFALTAPQGRMMGTKANPGKFDCYGKAEDDEPLFTLRAKDPYAPIVVEFWVRCVETQALLEHGATLPADIAEKLEEARDCANAMRVWRENREALAAATAQAVEERDGRTGALDESEATWRHADGSVRVDHMDSQQGDYYGTALGPTGSQRRCPRCGSHSPNLHPAVQHEGEVQVCGDPFHADA